MNKNTLLGEKRATPLQMLLPHELVLSQVLCWVLLPQVLQKTLVEFTSSSRNSFFMRLASEEGVDDAWMESMAGFRNWKAYFWERDWSASAVSASLSQQVFSFSEPSENFLFPHVALLSPARANCVSCNI